jgi:hypothetical protein
MDRTLATADAMTLAAAHNRRTGTPRLAPASRHPGYETRAAAAARHLPREFRISHVFRTRGRGLVAEYDPT